MMEYGDNIFLDLDLVDTEKAIFDPVVAEVVSEAKSLALKINMENEWSVNEDYSGRDESIEKFDSEVAYLIETPAKISGILSPNHPEVPSLQVDEAAVDFMGFTSQVDRGKLDYLYAFRLYVDSSVEDGLVPLTREEVEDRYIQQEMGDIEGGVGVIHATASFDAVVVDFEFMHPNRALAWLADRDPSLVEEIDRRIIKEGGDFSERSLLSLKGMRKSFPEDMPESDRSRYLTTIDHYLSSLLELDLQVPYIVKLVDGLKFGEDTPRWMTNNSACILALRGIFVTCDSFDEGSEEIKVCLSGNLIDPNDPESNSVSFGMSIDYFESMISMRKTHSKLIKSLGRAGLAK